MEVDCLRYYQLDVLDLGSPRFTWRRLAACIAHLPRESATVQHAGGEVAQWGSLEHLVASLVELTQGTNYLLTKANFKKAGAPPERLARPGDSTREVAGRTSLTHDEMARRLIAQRDRGHRKG